MSDQTVTLVTGANKGIGYEIARGLGKLGWSVGVGARDQERRDAAVEKLREDGIDVFAVALDVTDQDSVSAAAAQIEERFGRLDVLVNNAGITGNGVQTPTQVDIETVKAAADVNVFGVIRSINTFLPLLRKSDAPRIVNVSSSVGSLTHQTTPGAFVGPISAAYSPTKTYLNAVTIQYAKELRETDPNLKINLACPGYVATDLNGFNGYRTPEQGAGKAIELAQLSADGVSGQFFDENNVLPW